MDSVSIQNHFSKFEDKAAFLVVGYKILFKAQAIPVLLKIQEYKIT